MKRKYRLDGLCCANCAAKMENGIAKLAGVEEVVINFMMQTMTLTASDEQFDAIYTEAEKIIHKIEPEIKIKRA